MWSASEHLFPHLGATPDGIVQYDCCGKELIEIKCPFEHRNKHPHSIDDHSFYVKKDESMHLSKDYDYLYQVQGQLAICNLEFCDFIRWTPLGMHCKRIILDQTFFDGIKPASTGQPVHIHAPTHAPHW